MTDAHASVVKQLRSALPDRLVPDAKLQEFDADASIFALTPFAVVRPRAEDDVRTVLKIGRRASVPVVARGGGSNTGGAAVTDGILIVFDGAGFSRIQVDPSTGRAVCGPGVRHDRLQSALAEIGRTLPSDPSSGPLSYIGGNVATRASGPHALRYGAINRYVEDLRFITADGTIIDTRLPETVPERLRRRLSELARRIAKDSASVARLEARRTAKWASGYELLALLDHPDDPVRALPRLITGSVGTLGIVTEVELQSVIAPTRKTALLLRFDDSADACSAAVDLRDAASAVEIVNRSALEIVRSHSDALGSDSRSQALLIVEYSGPDASDRARSDSQAIGRRYRLSANPELAESAQEIERIWRARKALLPVIRRLAGERGVPYSVVNDVGVEPHRLGELLEGAESIFARHAVIAPIYGHAGSGNLHLRPLFRSGDLETVSGVADEVYRLVTSLGGTITAEHGMGRLRAPFLALEWGETIVSFMRDLKSIFDPDDTLNPGAVFVPESHNYTHDRWPVRPRL